MNDEMYEVSVRSNLPYFSFSAPLVSYQNCCLVFTVADTVRPRNIFRSDIVIHSLEHIASCSRVCMGLIKHEIFINVFFRVLFDEYKWLS
jgi:hypothetical protein